MTYKISNEDKWNGSITLLFSPDGLTIELQDKASSIRFIEIELDPQQVVEAFSRRSRTPCNISCRGLEKVGKRMVMGNLEFEMPEHNYTNRDIIAKQAAERACPVGWESDMYFGSRDSFFRKNGKEFAKTIMRKWEEQPSRESVGS